MLWTRLAPEPQAPDGMGGMPPYKIQVTWQVATDEGFQNVVRAGSEQAAPELAHSVHAEVSGLLPSRDYWYRFLVGTEESPVGHAHRTGCRHGPRPADFRPRILPVLGRRPLRRLPDHGQEDLDLVVHVGDYIYEGRNHETLADFRNNHAKYKDSVDLQATHANFPFVVTFDDHEVENNWADGVSQPDNEASNDPERFLQLRANAFQAYYEHLPLRLPQRPTGPDMVLHRGLDYGNLARFHVLDTRQYRSDQLTENFPGGPQHPDVYDPSRTLMGDEQEQWLFDRLAS